MIKKLDDITFEYIALKIINPHIKIMIDVIRKIHDEEFSYIEYSKVKKDVEKILTEIELNSPSLTKAIKKSILEVKEDGINDNKDYIKNYSRDRCECSEMCKKEIIGSVLDLYANIERLENKIMEEEAGMN
jgi:hypothetical protein